VDAGEGYYYIFDRRHGSIRYWETALSDRGPVAALEIKDPRTGSWIQNDRH